MKICSNKNFTSYSDYGTHGEFHTFYCVCHCVCSYSAGFKQVLVYA